MLISLIVTTGQPYRLLIHTKQGTPNECLTKNHIVTFDNINHSHQTQAATTKKHIKYKQILIAHNSRQLPNTPLTTNIQATSTDCLAPKKTELLTDTNTLYYL